MVRTVVIAAGAIIALAGLIYLIKLIVHQDIMLKNLQNISQKKIIVR